MYLSLGLVVLWTARLAQSKMRNPWLWGGATLILMLVPWKLLGMVPLLALLVLRKPKQRSGARPDTAACPRCRTPQPQRPRFCTNCGWELGSNYLEEAASDKESTVSTTSAANPQQITIPESPAAAAKGPEPAPTLDRTSTHSNAPRPEEANPQETVAAEQPSASFTAPLGMPTAASMTERGVRLFNQGRIQESLDQFTKAIALDPNHGDAWARRAEAYARLGRGAEAAEDRRRLETLNAGSTGS
ncbi:MAG: tetratricopeptide repeat protein [Chloroflexota bacterium]